MTETLSLFGGRRSQGTKPSPSQKPLGRQQLRVLGWMKAGRTLDPQTAWRHLGITRLAARIFELKQAGYKITKVMKRVVNRWGEKCGVAEYKLEEPKK